MFGFIRNAIRFDGATQEEPTAIPPIAPLVLHKDDEEIPRYPPFMRGLPATPPDTLIETQRDLIGQIREAGLASPDIFEQFYLASLRRFASYAHLLPASQTHHHRGAGGLLRHAAEVALWSLQSGDRVLLPGEQAPDLYEAAVQLKLEGIVVKQLESPYVGGEPRTGHWVKIKRPGATPAQRFTRDTDLELGC